MSLRPSNAQPTAFYLQPLKTPNDKCWYSCKPIGHNPLSNTVRKLVGMVGQKGYYTNHSQRRTCATRIYNKGVDEQQIMSLPAIVALMQLEDIKKLAMTNK